MLLKEHSRRRRRRLLRQCGATPGTGRSLVAIRSRARAFVCVCVCVSGRDAKCSMSEKDEAWRNQVELMMASSCLMSHSLESRATLPLLGSRAPRRIKNSTVDS